MSEPARFRLKRDEQRRIRDGNPIPLIRDEKPDLKVGGHVIVSFSRERRYCDEEDGQVFTIPRKPTLWITVTRITRRRIGGWAVRYDITDQREQAMFLAPGSGYTTDASKAVDKREAPLSEKDRLKLATDARASHAARQERSKEELRRQERAHRVRLREALDGLSPEEQQVLLAGLQRQLENAGRREAA